MKNSNETYFTEFIEDDDSTVCSICSAPLHLCEDDVCEACYDFCGDWPSTFKSQN